MLRSAGPIKMPITTDGSDPLTSLEKLIRWLDEQEVWSYVSCGYNIISGVYGAYDARQQAAILKDTHKLAQKILDFLYDLKRFITQEFDAERVKTALAGSKAALELIIELDRPRTEINDHTLDLLTEARVMSLNARNNVMDVSRDGQNPAAYAAAYIACAANVIWIDKKRSKLDPASTRYVLIPTLIQTIDYIKSLKPQLIELIRNRVSGRHCDIDYYQGTRGTRNRDGDQPSRSVNTYYYIDDSKHKVQEYVEYGDRYKQPEEDFCKRTRDYIIQELDNSIEATRNRLVDEAAKYLEDFDTTLVSLEAELVHAVYRDILNRKFPDNLVNIEDLGGLNHYCGVLRLEGYEKVRYYLAQSDEAKGLIVTCYQNILKNDDPTDAQLKSGADKLEKDGYHELRYQIANSRAGKKKIKDAYQVLLHRAPIDEELVKWVDVLAKIGYDKMYARLSVISPNPQPLTSRASLRRPEGVTLFPNARGDVLDRKRRREDISLQPGGR